MAKQMIYDAWGKAGTLIEVNPRLDETMKRDIRQSNPSGEIACYCQNPGRADFVCMYCFYALAQRLSS